MFRILLLKKSLILSSACVLFFIASNLAGCASTQTQQASDLNQPSNRVLPAEIAESLQRKQATTQKQANTKTTAWGIGLDEKRGFVWVAEPGCDPTPVCKDPVTGATAAFPGRIGKFAMSDGSAITDFPQPKGFSSPFFIGTTPDGRVWFTEINGDAIGEFNPDTQDWRQYRLTPGSAPYDLAIDNNGNIWFTEYLSNQIGFINTKTSKVVENAIPTPGSKPYEIMTDRKGNIWFAENGKYVSRIGTFTPTTSGVVTIREYVVEANGLTQPHGITSDPEGHIWFSEGFSGTIAEFDPATETVLGRYAVGKATTCRRPPYNCTHISGVESDNKGNIWFTDSLNAVVGYFSQTNKTVRVQMLRDPLSHPHDGLAVQSNGTVWFTEQYGSQQEGGPVLGMLPPGSLK